MPRKTQYNKITSPEILEQVCKENKEIKRDFLTYLKSTQHSTSTIAAYENDIDIWCAWNLKENRNKPFVDMTKRNLIAFQNWLIYDNGNSPARVKRIKSTLSSMSAYIEDILDDEYPGFRNIIGKVKSPTGRLVREKTVFNEEDLDGLLTTLTEKGQYMQACALALAMFGGRRKSELPRFKADWFKDEYVIYGSLYKTPEKVRTKGAGDGKFIYCYTLKHKFDPYLQRFMQWRAEKGIESEWLLFDQNNPAEQLPVSTLNSWAKTFSTMLNADFYWHSIRHYHTTYLAQSGLPDPVIQNLIGWASSDLVRLYDDTSQDEAIGKYFDENGIKADAEQKGLADL